MLRLILKFSILGILTAATLFTMAGAADDIPDEIADPEPSQTPAPPKDPGESDGNKVMIEMHLSPDGVYGLDSSGREWDFDFSQDSFVTKTQGKSSTVTVFGRKRDKDNDTISIDVEVGDDSDSSLTITTYRGLVVGSVEVGPDEKVKGSIVATGPVTVEGIVTGDVTSYSKITITAEGKILGDARAPQIVKMRGGRIYGERSETDIPDLPGISLFGKSSNTQLIVNLIILGTLLFCTLILVTVAPRAVDRVTVCLKTCLIKSFFTGLLIWILLTPVMALLILTIIGIPVAVIILPLAVIGAFILGVIGFSQLVGAKIGRIIINSKGTQLLAAVVGLVIFSLPWLLAGFLEMTSSSFLGGLATFFNVISIIIWSIGATAGIGAVFMTRFGNRDCRKIQLQKMQQDWNAVRPAPPPPTPPPLQGD